MNTEKVMTVMFSLPIKLGRMYEEAVKRCLKMGQGESDPDVELVSSCRER